MNNTPIEEMTDRDLLMELVGQKRKEQRYNLIKMILLAVLITVIVLAGYYYLRPAIEAAQAISASLKEVTDFMDANKDVVATIEKLANEIDMTKINGIADTMKQLEPIIESLGKLFGQ